MCALPHADVNPSTGLPCVVGYVLMPLMEKGTLWGLLCRLHRKGWKMSERMAVGLIESLLAGAAELEGKGIIHG